MAKHENIIAASILGLSLIIAAVIMSSGMRSASDRIRGGLAFPPSPRIPDTITLSSGNGRFKVDVQPLKVEVQPDKK